MIKELRSKTDQELGQLITKLKAQLLQLRFDAANGKTENSFKSKEIRKTIAKAMTVLSQRNIDVSFSTFDTQLISQKDNKQHISVVNFDFADNKANTTNKTKKSEPTKNEVKKG